MVHQGPDLVCLHGIEQRFGPLVTALHDVSLTIRAGEFVAVTGTSGSGKSTLLHILGLLARPSSGRYDLDGRAVGSLRDEQLADMRAHTIGFVFQAFHLVPHLTAVENVEASLAYQGMPRRGRRRAALTALASVGLTHRIDAFPATLSGGEQQRVAIARAVVRQPRLLLCDEPTGNLDTANTEAVMAILEQSVTVDRALVVVTHDPEVAARARRVVVLQDGQVLSDHAVGR
jgi:putative ABC transport system ATP-binding protein